MISIFNRCINCLCIASLTLREPPPSQTFPAIRICSRKSVLILTDWAKYVTESCRYFCRFCDFYCCTLYVLCRSFHVEKGRFIRFRRSVDQDSCNENENYNDGKSKSVTNIQQHSSTTNSLALHPFSTQSEIYSDKVSKSAPVVTSLPRAKKFIILIRNPYEALVASYERFVTERDLHAKVSFVIPTWEQFALAQARLLTTIWLSQFQDIIRNVYIHDVTIVDYRQLVDDDNDVNNGFLAETFNKIISIVSANCLPD